jgi:hypothetical protein
VRREKSMFRTKSRTAISGTIAAFTILVFATPARTQAQKEPAGKSSDLKAQSALATKGALPTIAEKDAEYKQALQSHDLAGAKSRIGKDGAIQGVVAKVFAPSSNMLVILNFDKNYKNALVAVIKAEDFAKFPDLGTLRDKHVLVKGKFIDYNGVPELSVTNAGAIKIVKQPAK